MHNLPDANRAHGAKQGLGFPVSRERENPDIRQIGPDLLAVGDVRFCHPLPDAKRLRLRRDAGFHRSLQSSVQLDRKSTRLNSSHSQISYAVFCLKKKKTDTMFSANTMALPAHASRSII